VISITIKIVNKVGFPISVIGNTIPAYESREFTVDKIPSVNKRFASVEVIKETVQQAVETKSVETVVNESVEPIETVETNESTVNEEEVAKPTKRKTKKSQPTTDGEENEKESE